MILRCLPLGFVDSQQCQIFSEYPTEQQSHVCGHNWHNQKMITNKSISLIKSFTIKNVKCLDFVFITRVRNCIVYYILIMMLVPIALCNSDSLQFHQQFFLVLLKNKYFWGKANTFLNAFNSIICLFLNHKILFLDRFLNGCAVCFWFTKKNRLICSAIRLHWFLQYVFDWVNGIGS